jgi:selenocysteine lyase/cysteine desulfurase
MTEGMAIKEHYLDYAATSAIRPPQVAESVYRFLRDVGATPGRSGHHRALEAGRVAFRCRKAVARILSIPGDPGRIVFGLNATQGLNTALWGLLGEGDVVVTTPFDHNAVLRPLHRLAAERGVKVRMIPGDAMGALDLAEARELLVGARLLVVNAVSNVLGTRLPMKELGAMAQEAGALFLVDGAQWAGHFTESLPEAGADLVAFTGHKGLLGPQGIGGLWVREGVELVPFFAGGTGGNSKARTMPSALPDALEAGSGNAPGMAGLSAGVTYLEDSGVEDLHRREQELKGLLWGGLESLSGVKVLSPPAPNGVGIVSLVPLGMDPRTLAQRLDREWGVMVRYGLNCAPEVHNILGTGEAGAVRFSLGWASTPEDVEAAVRGVDAITSAPAVPVS